MSQGKRPPAKRPARQPARQPVRQSARRPAAQPKPFLTPGGSPFRHAVERRSAVVAVFLHKLPRALPGLLVVALVATALLAPPVLSGLALLVVAVFLTWLVYLSWPAIHPPARALRVVVIALVVGYGLARVVAP